MIFVEQLKNFAQPGDLFMAISGSGNSPNVVLAMDYANFIGCRTIALTGRDGGKLGPKAQLNIQVPVQQRAHQAQLLLHAAGELACLALAERFHAGHAQQIRQQAAVGRGREPPRAGFGGVGTGS